MASAPPRHVELDDVDVAAAPDAGQTPEARRRTLLRRLAKAGLAVVVLAGVLVGVILAVSASSGSTGIKVPEKMSASFTATAKADSDQTAVYRGKLHKTVDASGAWVVSAQVTTVEGDGNTHVITVDNDRAYYAITSPSGELLETGCVPQDAIPPYPDIRGAFELAAVVPKDAPVADYAVGRCRDAGQTLYTISWADETYVFCALNNGANVNQFVGDLFTADVFNVDTTPTEKPEWSVPKALDGSDLDCPVMEAYRTAATDAAAATEQARRLRQQGATQAHVHYPDASADPESTPWYLRVADETDAAGRRAALKTLSPRRRLAAAKRCVFVHGLGRSTPGPTVSTLESYWGKVHDNVHCESKRFMQLDTVNKAWDDITLQQAFCTEAVNGNSGGAITDTIIFSHSMGSLIVAGSLHGGSMCHLSTGSKWYAVSGPATGSKAADWVSAICSGGKSTLQWLATELGFCVNGQAGVSVSSCKTTYKAPASYSAVQAVYNANLAGIMCGTSSWGLNTKYAAATSAIASVVSGSLPSGQSWDSPDGVVAFPSCGAGATSGYSSSSSGDRFQGSLNHLDTTGRNGDGWYGGDARKPLKWYSAHA